MSYICKTCGVITNGIKQVKVITILRKVIYLYKLQYHIMETAENYIPVMVDSYTKTVKTANGTEIVNEDIYCYKCVPTITPKIIGEVTRETILKIIYRNKAEDNKHKNKKFRGTNKYGRTRASR